MPSKYKQDVAEKASLTEPAQDVKKQSKKMEKKVVKIIARKKVEDQHSAVAVIDIASNELRLKIAQKKKKNLEYLESLNYPLSLGRDTFNKGKISFDKIDKACDIIKNFLTVAKEYGVSSVKAVATTAVREATNSDYILDQIKIKTGTEVQVLDDSEEKFYIYKLISHLCPQEQKQSALMVHIGSGNIGISVLEDGTIPYMESIKLGTLRITELFDSMHEYSTEFYLVVEEYINSFINMLHGVLPEGMKNFIVSGSEMQMIANLCKAKQDGVFYYFSREAFLALYDEIKYKSVEKIAVDYNLSEDKAEMLLPALCIYNSLLRFTQSDRFVAPNICLVDACIYEHLYSEDFAKIHKEFHKNTIKSAQLFAKKFNVVTGHHTHVAHFAKTIFDKMKKIHGLAQREKLLLEVSCILHDIGKFVNSKSHYTHSYYLVKNLEIVGLNTEEINIVAGICLYHSRLTPSMPSNAPDEYYLSLSPRNRVLVSKLSAILRLADSLDRGNFQKFNEIEIKVDEDELVITIALDKNTELEQWSFKEKSLFFEEVFGIKAVLKKKQVYAH